MTIVIKSFALVYDPIKETTKHNEDGSFEVFFEGYSSPAVVQANDMPEYLQVAIVQYLKERYEDVVFKSN